MPNIISILRLSVSIFILGIFGTAYCAVRIENGEVPIKNLARIEGMRENPMVGYGLVVGLSGTGDNLNNAVFTQKALTDFLAHLGVNTQGANLKTKNIAAVTVTGNLGPFARNGSSFTVKIAAVGDAKSLVGGTLLPTPLVGADGSVYAVAQGPVTVSEFVPTSADVKTKSNSVATNGYIQNGAIVENEIDFNFGDLTHVKFALYSPDFSTAIALANAINNYVTGNTAVALDAGTVQVTVPDYRRNDVIEFIAEIEKLGVSPDYKAKIVIDEAAGTVVMTGDIYVNKVAIAHGNLVVNVGQLQYDNLSPMLAPDKQDNINKFIDSKRGRTIHQLNEGANLSDLVAGLNKLGAYTRDIIAILRQLQEAGAILCDIRIK